MTGGECWLCWWRHEPTRWHDSKRDVCNLPSMSLFCKSRHTTMSKRLTEECEGFLKRFLSHVALGRFGPNCKLFFSTFSILLEYELYTLICLCKNTFILFKLWSLGNQDNPCSECRTVYLLCITTFKHLALNEVWWRASYLLGYELHEMQWRLSNVLLNTK